MGSRPPPLLSSLTQMTGALPAYDRYAPDRSVAVRFGGAGRRALYASCVGGKRVHCGACLTLTGLPTTSRAGTSNTDGPVLGGRHAQRVSALLHQAFFVSEPDVSLSCVRCRVHQGRPLALSAFTVVFMLLSALIVLLSASTLAGTKTCTALVRLWDVPVPLPFTPASAFAVHEAAAVAVGAVGLHSLTATAPSPPPPLQPLLPEQPTIFNE